MPIRQRIVKTMPKPEYRDGHPDWLFEGFRMRFGQVAAVFTNAKMQANSGLADPSLIRKPGPAATIFFVYRDGAERMLRDRAENATNPQIIQDVLDIWPENGQIPSEHRNRIGDE